MCELQSYGRVPTAIAAFSLAGVAGLATIFTGGNYVAFLICRALVGFVSYKGTIPMIHGMKIDFCPANHKFSFFPAFSLLSSNRIRRSRRAVLCCHGSPAVDRLDKHQSALDCLFYTRLADFSCLDVLCHVFSAGCFRVRRERERILIIA